MPRTNPASWRNIIIYIAGTMILSITGGTMMVMGQEIGGLVFVISPILMATLLRFFAGDGWRTAGLRLNLRGNAGHYALSLLVYPTAFAIAMMLGTLFGAVEIQPNFASNYAAAAAAIAAQWFAFALFEEFGWRGYLDPQLDELGVPNAKRHLMVAAIWGTWHVPFIYATASYTGLPIPIFAVMFSLSILTMTVWYGLTRARTRSVWPAVIAHGMGNTLAWPLLNPDIVTIQNKLTFAPRPDAIVVLLVMAAVALFLWSRQR